MSVGQYHDAISLVRFTEAKLAYYLGPSFRIIGLSSNAKASTKHKHGVTGRKAPRRGLFYPGRHKPRICSRPATPTWMSNRLR